MRRISKKGKIIFFIFLIVGITLLSVGGYFIIRSSSLDYINSMIFRMMAYFFLIWGGIITFLDIFGGIFLVPKSRRPRLLFLFFLVIGLTPIVVGIAIMVINSPFGYTNGIALVGIGVLVVGFDTIGLYLDMRSRRNG